jgi:23S rRNA (guanosine2251-2'-O)-methyltransferase
MKKPDKIYIYGKHAVMEALKNSPKLIRKIYLSPRQEDTKLRVTIARSGVPVSALDDRKDIGRIEGGGTHQGVIGVVSSDDMVRPFKEFLKGLKITNDTCLVIMSELQDPHNVGAVIRSAAAFGMAGVLMPEHNQSPVTGAVVKVSAGMAFRIPLVRIGNINQCVRDLKDAGFKIYGLEGEGGQDISKKSFDGPSVFIIGNEAEGIRMKTKELCDSLVAIQIHPKCESLNAAASTAIALYAWSVKHPNAVKY